MSRPLVSIVTPVYNGARFLQECISSALTQRYPNWEYIIVDNCSTDDTPNIIERFAQDESRIRVIRHPKTVNALRNHNMAVAHMDTDSKYCKILHADDQLRPDCLDKMVAVAERDPSIGMVGSLAHAGPTIVGKGLAEQPCFDGSEIARRTLLGEIYPFWSPTCLLLKSQAVLEREMFWDEDHFNADVRCAYEILQRWNFGFVHEPLTIIRDHSGSRTSQIAKPMKKLLATNLDLFTTYAPTFLTAEERQARLSQILEHYYQDLAHSALERRDAEFWSYHRQALAAAGHTMSSKRLSKRILGEVRRAPVKSLRRLVRSFLSRRQIQV